MAGLLIALGLMIIAASLFALVAKRFRQPLIIGYILAGFLIGPGLFGIIDDPEPIALLSELGLIFLLFIIGLELDIRKIKNLGRSSIFLGLAQMVVTCGVAGLIAWLADFTLVQSFYLGMVITFSSTIIVVKLLTDKNELHSLHGELLLGILVIQDILAVLALSFVGIFSTQMEGISMPVLPDLLASLGVLLPQEGWVQFLAFLFQAILFLLFTYGFSRFVMPVAFRDIVSSPELAFVASLAVVFIISALAGFFEFSLAIGAFVAGITLSSASYSHDLLGRVRPLKDFFLILFFVSMGLQVSVQNLADHFSLIAFLILGALLLKPVILFFLLKIFKYNNRTSFIVSLHLAQVGEFSLILISGGVLAGILPAEILSGTVLATIFTMMVSAYLIKYAEIFYRLFRPLIMPSNYVFNMGASEIRNVPDHYASDIVVFGVTPLTEGFITDIAGKRKLLVVEENPSVAIELKNKDIPTFCSDFVNIDLYNSMDFSKASIVVVAVDDVAEELHGPNTLLFILKKFREVNAKAALIFVAQSPRVEKMLYENGATIVLTPNLVGRQFLAGLLKKSARLNRGS